MIQLSQTAVRADRAEIQRLAADFEATGCAQLPGFLAPPILKPLLDWVGTARFGITNEVSGSGRQFGTTQFAAQDDRAVFLIHFILNRPDLFRVIEQITNSPALGNFRGRLHRTSAAAGDQFIDWHSDAVEARTVGLTINLSTEEYSGGVLLLRDAEGMVRAEAGRAPAGDAFLFRIDRDWKHKLTPLQSGSRTVAVGWFRTSPDWLQYAANANRFSSILAEANSRHR